MKRLWHALFGHGTGLQIAFPEPISCSCGKKWHWIGTSYREIVRDDPSEVQCEVPAIMWEAVS